MRTTCIGMILCIVALVGCGSSSKTIRTPLVADSDTHEALIKGAKAMGCDPGQPDDLIGLMIDCPDGRIVYGHDIGENMREEKEGEPYPIEVICFDGLAEKCQQTIDEMLAAGKR